METGMDGTDLDDAFSPQQYLNQYFSHKPGSPQNYYRDVRVQLIHECFENLLPNDLVEKKGDDFKVLDYGAGPVVAHVISAAGKESVSEIVLAEYTSRNRAALQEWIDRKDTAFDWKAYFKHVVLDLEKRPESDVNVREDRLRSLLKVASCDITADQPIEKGFEGPYDVVMTFVAIESACRSEADYKTCIEKLSRLIKPNGTFLTFTKLAKQPQSITYNVGAMKLYYYTVSMEMVLSALNKAGFGNVQSTHVSIKDAISMLPNSEVHKYEGQPCEDDEFFYVFISATKKG